MVRRVAPARVRSAAHSMEKYYRYGPGFPRAMEPLEVPTGAVRRAIPNPLEVLAVRDGKRARRSYRKAVAARGHVVRDKDFARFVQVPVEQLVKYRCCVAHWRDGVSWEDTGVFDHMLRKIEHAGRPESGCGTIEDLRRRYARLDRVFDQVRREGRLLHAHELGPVARGMVWDGIEIHIGPHGEPIFGDAGTHRLAMAQVLGLRRIPALLGFVHEAAVVHLPRFRMRVSAWLVALSPWSWVLVTI